MHEWRQGSGHQRMPEEASLGKRTTASTLLTTRAIMGVLGERKDASRQTLCVFEQWAQMA